MDYSKYTIEELQEELIRAQNRINNFKNSNFSKGNKKAMLMYKEVNIAYNEALKQK